MNQATSGALLLLGVVCVLAGAVGGGLKVMDVEVPHIGSPARQALLATIGLAVIAFVVVDPTKHQAAARGFPAECAEALGTASDVPTTEARETRIAVAPRPAAIAVGRDAVWVAHETGHVTRIDPNTNDPRLLDLRVGTKSGSVSIAVDLGSVWMTKLEPGARGFRARIRSGHLVSTQETDDPDNVDTGSGYIWLTHNEGRLTRWDPDDFAHSGRHHKLTNVRGEPRGLSVSDSLCAYVATSSAIAVVDTETTRLLMRPPIEGPAREVAAGEGGVWVTTDSRVLRLDPGDPGDMTFSRSLAPHPDALAVGRTGVWTADGRELVYRIDPSDLNDKPDVFTVGGEPVAVAVGGNPESVWVALRGSASVTRIRY